MFFVVVAVHRRGGLYAVAEGPHGIGGAQLYGLYDVVAVLAAAGNDPKAQPFIEVRGEYRALQRAGDHRGGYEAPSKILGKIKK